MKKNNIILIVLIVLSILSLSNISFAGVIGEPIIVDADTIKIQDNVIRLAGIDAPEAKQTCRKNEGVLWKCGQEASLALSHHITSHHITSHQLSVLEINSTATIG